jgi:hypothetical protein
MVFNLTHSQLILRYKENGGRIEPYTIVIMVATKQAKIDPKTKNICCTQQLDEGSDREEKERLRDLDNNVPRAA